MPHLFVKEITPYSLPQTINEVTFLFQSGTLIACEIEGKRFFIECRPKGGMFLVKYDKLTRPVISYLKKAYQAFTKLSHATVISSNIENVKERVPDQNLITVEDLHFDKPLIIEVGFGSGRHLLHLAKKYPEYMIIGIEIHQPSLEQVLRRIEHEKIENVRLINYDARLLLSNVASNSVKEIHVHFPVPWDEKPHRRVISVEFIDESIRALDQDGLLHLRTDSDNYFNYSFGEFMQLNQNRLEIKKNSELGVTSKYEKRWKKMEKNIYDIILYNTHLSKELHKDYDFSFESLDATKVDLKAHKFDDFIIHFESLSPINEKESLLRLTMGAFNRPEHLYIIVGEKSRYLSSPIALPINQKAHHAIKELLHG